MGPGLRGGSQLLQVPCLQSEGRVPLSFPPLYPALQLDLHTHFTASRAKSLLLSPWLGLVVPKHCASGPQQCQSCFSLLFTPLS